MKLPKSKDETDFISNLKSLRLFKSARRDKTKADPIKTKSKSNFKDFFKKKNEKGNNLPYGSYLSNAIRELENNRNSIKNERMTLRYLILSDNCIE